MRPALRQNLLLLAAALGVVVVLAEIGLRAFSPVENPYAQIERLRPQVNQYIRLDYPRRYAAVTEAEPGLPGLSGMNNFTTNNMGFRGDDLAIPKSGEFRIFVMGGSAVECFYIDDDDEIGRVMQRELATHMAPDTPVRVYNVGLSGAASDDYVAMIGQRLVHLEPDLIVLLTGINDLARSIYRYDYLHYIEYQPAYRKPWYKRSPMKLQIVRRLFYLRYKVKPDPERMQEQRTLVSNYRGLAGLQRTVPPSNEAPRTDEASYADNLLSIVGMARAHGFGLVFVTQPTTWNSTVDPTAREWHWMRLRAGITYREDLMDAAMERLNDVTRRIGAESGVPVYDLAHEIPKSLQFFYDDCHFNPAGAAFAGTGIARFLVGQGLMPPPPPGAKKP